MADRRVPGYAVVLPDGSFVPVDEGDVEAAKFSIELAQEDGRAVDPALEAIANAGVFEITDDSGASDTIDVEVIPDVRVENVKVRVGKAKKQPKTRVSQSRSAVSGSYGVGKSLRTQRNPK